MTLVFRHETCAITPQIAAFPISTWENSIMRVYLLSIALCAGLLLGALMVPSGDAGPITLFGGQYQGVLPGPGQGIGLLRGQADTFLGPAGPLRHPTLTSDLQVKPGGPFPGLTVTDPTGAPL